MKNLHFEEEFLKACTLNVDIKVGSVEIDSHNGRFISVDVQFEAMDIDVYRQENTLFIKAVTEKSSDNTQSWVQKLLQGSKSTTHFKINVPENCTINGNIITGKTVVTNVNAPVTVRTTTGSTQLRNIGGPIYAKTVTGKLTYDGILTDEQHRFETITGSIRLRLHKEPNVMVDASTITGKLNVDFPLHKKSEKRHVTGGRVKGMLGSGNGRIKAKIITGSLSILQA